MANLQSCVLVIGNEVLSGRTQDANIRFLAERLGALGLPVREVRIIPDVANTIVETVNECRARYDLVFTTGGIGPTHDDITSECVAAAFGVPWEPHAESMALLGRMYEARGIELNAARRRMATLPRGATPIENPISTAPGFTIGNVHVMAGVPNIMRAMFDCLVPNLPAGAPVRMRAVHALNVGEGNIAAPLQALAERYPELDLGSYPFYTPERNGVAIVAKGTDAAMLDAAREEITALFVATGHEPVDGEPPALPAKT